MEMMDYFEFEKFEGMTFVNVYMGTYDGNDALYFVADDGKEYVMTHEQSCCESVYLADVVGNFDDIISSKIYTAYVNTNAGEEDYGHYTYTFYTLASFNGVVTLRWNGSSNGYYSENCDVYRVK